MNRRPRAHHRLRGAVAGITATLFVFGLADLIARVVYPDAAPLLALSQALIPLAPPAAIKPVIAVFGDHDKLVLVITAGLGALVIGGLIGLLAVRRRVTAQVLFVIAGLVPALAVITRPGTTIAEVAPALIGLGAGLLAFRLLLGPRRPLRADSTAAPSPLSRRRFFTLAGVITGIGAVTIAAGQTAASLARTTGEAVAKLVLPTPAETAAPIPKAASSGVPGTADFVTQAKDFYRIDTVLTPPTIDPREWSLHIHGMVENEVTLTMDDVLGLPLEEHHITLTCVSNPVGGDLVGNATWLGYPVRELLSRARPNADADMVLSHSFDGFTASTPLPVLTDDRAALLAVGMNGEPLTPIHGFPARLVVPGLYGFVSATKWVTELEVTRFDEKTAYWTDRGWDALAPILVASRIEVPKPLATIAAGTLRVGGTAWAQHTGIAAVEVRLDDGQWTQADLAEEVTVDTWRQWRAEFAEVAPGSHTLTVRATDRDGTVQTAKRRDSIPNSATGHHHIQFRVE